MKGLFIAATLACGFLVPSVASAKSGAEISEWSKTYASGNVNHPDYGLYLGYVIGAVDAMDGILFCAPASVTYKQAAMMLAQHLEKNPSQWDMPGAFILGDTMKQVFPCADDKMLPNLKRSR